MSEAIVHLIDDDEAVRTSLAFVLEMNDLAARTYASALEFLEVADAASGCVVTDVRMPGMSGLELVRRLKERAIGLPVVVMTGHGDVPLAVEAMRAGVIDFIEKPFEDEVLLRSIRMALAHKAAPTAPAQERQRFEQMLATLSGRETEVLRGVIAGKMNKVIAYELGISPRTVEVYRANVMSKTTPTACRSSSGSPCSPGSEGLREIKAGLARAGHDARMDQRLRPARPPSTSSTTTPRVRRALEFALDLEGFAVETYESARRLLLRDRPVSPGCLVLDERLPAVSGLDTLRQLRARRWNSRPSS
jgi:two-component system response regulator FixJ